MAGIRAWMAVGGQLEVSAVAGSVTSTRTDVADGSRRRRRGASSNPEIQKSLDFLAF